MAQGEFIAGYFQPLERPEIKPPRPPAGIWPPLVKPPLPPGVGEPGHPLPDPEPEPEPGKPGLPIFLPDEPGHPLPLPPGTVWPPVNPGEGLQGKILLLCWIPGVGSRWVVVELPPLPGWTPEHLPSQPPIPQPKRP